ncbi:MAG: LLM class flavin-dependent oxidoreductase [Candidatus Limnocylindria bacterium]
MTGTPRLAFGITAADRPDHVRLGADLERLGYDELWANDTRAGDGLATLTAAAVETTSLGFGVGVIALSEQHPPQIADRLAGSGLPIARLVLGVGSGSSASLQLVRDGVAEMRRLVPGVSIGMAAIGPRMAHLAGEIADVVIANWAVPERLAWVRGHVAEGATDAGRPEPRFVAYVRTAVGPDAAGRLQAEMDRYRGYGAYYARAFEAQPPGLIGVAGSGQREVVAGIAAYAAIADTTVVRGLPADDSVDAWLTVARAAAYALPA